MHDDDDDDSICRCSVRSNAYVYVLAFSYPMKFFKFIFGCSKLWERFYLIIRNYSLVVSFTVDTVNLIHTQIT